MSPDEVRGFGYILMATFALLVCGTLAWLVKRGGLSVECPICTAILAVVVVDDKQEAYYCANCGYECEYMEV